MDMSLAQHANQVTQTLATHEPSNDSVVEEIDDSDKPVPVVLLAFLSSDASHTPHPSHLFS